MKSVRTVENIVKYNNNKNIHENTLSILQHRYGRSKCCTELGFVTRNGSRFIFIHDCHDDIRNRNVNLWSKSLKSFSML